MENYGRPCDQRGVFGEMTKDTKVILMFTGIFVAAAFLGKCGTAHGNELVVASTYGGKRDATPNKFLSHLRSLLATGQPFDANGMTAAHKTLPFGTKVTLKYGHRSLVVTINDRGPYVHGRTFDLTPAASKYLRCDLCRVRVESWPPLPRPRPEIPEPMFAWGAENEQHGAN